MSKVLTYDSPTNLCVIRRTIWIPGPFSKYPIQLTPEQEACLQHLSTCYTAPCAAVQRACLRLLAHHHPDWRTTDIAPEVGCTPETVRQYAPQQWGPWSASLALSCAVRISWLPTHASGLEQVEIIFSKVQPVDVTRAAPNGSSRIRHRAHVHYQPFTTEEA